MTTPDPTSALAGIREDIEATVDVYNLDGAGKNSYPVSAAMTRHARVLLAAVEAVLALRQARADARSAAPPVCLHPVNRRWPCP